MLHLMISVMGLHPARCGGGGPAFTRTHRRSSRWSVVAAHNTHRGFLHMSGAYPDSSTAAQDPQVLVERRRRGGHRPKAGADVPVPARRRGRACAGRRAVRRCRRSHGALRPALILWLLLNSSFRYQPCQQTPCGSKLCLQGSRLLHRIARVAGRPMRCVMPLSLSPLLTHA